MILSNTKLLVDVPYKTFLSSWELKAKTGTVYPQQEYLIELQKLYKDNLSNIIQDNWIYLSSLITAVDNCTTEYVFLAINRYMLLPEIISSIDDYNLAIIDYCQSSKKYKVIESRFDSGIPGNTGNAVFPDIGIVYEKKPS